VFLVTLQSQHNSETEFVEYIIKKCNERSIQVIDQIRSMNTSGHSFRDVENDNRVRNIEHRILTIVFKANYQTKFDLEVCFSNCPKIISNCAEKIL
jgi:hypothetical protein